MLSYEPMEAPTVDMRVLGSTDLPLGVEQRGLASGFRVWVLRMRGLGWLNEGLTTACQAVSMNRPP